MVFPVHDPHQIRETYASYLKDESRLGGEASYVFFPHSEEDVVEIVAEAHGERFSITPSGGRTGVVGGAVPWGGAVLSFERMDRLLGFEYDQYSSTWFVRCQPGVTLNQLDEALDPKNPADFISGRNDFMRVGGAWFYAPDPTERTAHLGGTVATDASGSRSFHYGSTRSYVRGFRIVLANGAVLDLNRGDRIVHAGEHLNFPGPLGPLTFTLPSFRNRPIQHAPGYFLDSPVDLVDLFIGSEGTLGLFTELRVRLSPQSKQILTAVAFFGKEAQALRFGWLLKKNKHRSKFPINPIALEFFDTHTLRLLKDHGESGFPIPNQATAALLFEQPCEETNTESLLDAYGRLLSECGSDLEHTWGTWNPQEASKILAFRHAVPECINRLIGERQRQYPQIHKIGTDFLFPPGKEEEMIHFYHAYLDSSGLDYVLFGHLGENHLHANLLPKDAREFEKAKSLVFSMGEEVIARGGNISGEHGVGKIKRPLFYRMYTKGEIAQMKSVKTMFDPWYLFSPHTLFFLEK